MWKTLDLGVAKMVAWSWANYPKALSGQSPYSVVLDNGGYGVVAGEKEGAEYIARPGDELPIKVQSAGAPA